MILYTESTHYYMIQLSQQLSWTEKNDMETFNNAEYLRKCLKDKRAELAHLVMSEGCPILIQITEDTILRMVDAIKHEEVKA